MLVRIYLILLALFPYSVPALVGAIALDWMLVDGMIALAGIAAYWLALVVATIIFCRKGKDPQAMARANMWVKVTQIPAYLFLFVLGVFLAVSVITLIFALLLMIFDVATILLTGTVGATAAGRAYRQGLLPKRAAIMHGVLQFVFVADVVSAILLYRKIQKA